MSEIVREYNTPGSFSDTLPAGATHLRAYIVGGGANGVAGNGSEGGHGGGGGAFTQFDVDTNQNSVYSGVVGAAGGQSLLSHVLDNQMTTGQSQGWAGGASGQSGAPASSCGRSGYGSGQISNTHKGGDGALKGANGDDGGGGGGGGRVVADGGDGMGNAGSGLGGGNGGTASHHDGYPGACVGTGASANTGGGGGGGYAVSNAGGQGSPGLVRVTITVP